MEKLIGIIADDLTGANDSGVQLTEKGINTSVLFEIPSGHDKLDSGVVIDTNSRTLSKHEATLATKQASLFLQKAGYQHIYKKMDSTLRGHIGAELKVLQEVFQSEYVFVIPAFPSMGRTTKDGIHFVNGEKIANTEISRDPKHPVMESYIPAIMEKEIGETVGLLTRSDFEDPAALQLKLESFKENQITFIVGDAETSADLQLAAEQLATNSTNVIWAGSAGLAEFLPEVLGITQNTQTQSYSTSDQVMTVCGSLSQVTQNQVRFAAQQSNVAAIEVDTIRIFKENWNTHLDEYIQQCLTGLKEDKDIVLFVPSNNQIREQVKQIGNELGINSNEIGARISGAIGEIVTEVTNMYPSLSGLVLTGGDTAKDTSSKLGGIGIRLIKQLEPGIPMGSLIGTKREFTVVTKAGAFGNESSIFHAMQELKGVQSNE